MSGIKNRSEFDKLKKIHNQRLLLFEAGDFLEAYFEDATTLTQELGLALVSKQRSNPIPMTFFTTSLADVYIERLVRAGISVSLVSSKFAGARSAPKSHSEAQIERAFVRYAESIGVLALKLRIDGMNGWPDRTVIHDGLLMFVEFKAPKGKLRPGQKTWIGFLRALGYTVLTPKRIGEAEAELDRLIRRSTQP